MRSGKEYSNLLQVRIPTSINLHLSISRRLPVMHGGAARITKQTDLPMNSSSPSHDAPEDDSVDAFRRRAVSEVVRNGTSRWRIVAAWSSLRRSWDSKRQHDLGSSDLDDSDASNPSLNLPSCDMASFPPSRPDEPPPSALRPPRQHVGAAAGAAVAEQPAPEVVGGTETTSSKDGEEPQSHRPRKRVSLFLRRRGRFRDGAAAFSANYGPGCAQVSGDSDIGGESGDLRQFRRAQSHLVKPVSFSDSDARFSRRRGEAGRYMEYAAEFDDDSFEALRDRTMSAFKKLRPAAIRLAPGVALEQQTTSSARPPTPGTPTASAHTGTLKLPIVSVAESDTLGKSFAGLGAEVVTDGDGDADDGEIIGEICLEDFADADSEDFEFLDGQIVDVWTDGEGTDGKPSLRLDGQQIGWFGEKEFAAFCAEVGLHEFFEVPKPSEKDLDTFRVGDQLFDQWRDDARIHNSLAARWGAKELLPPIDVRILAMSV